MRILELHHQMNRDIHSLKETDHGCIRMGTSPSRGEFFIDRILPVIRRQYPNLNLSLVLDARESLMQKLDGGELDLVFASNYAERPYLKYTKIAREEMVLVVPQDHELVKKARRLEGYTYPYVELPDWIGYPFIMGATRMITGQYTRLLFQHYQQQPFVALEVGSLQMIYSAVSRGLGITIAPSMPLCQKDHQNLQYLSFEDKQNIPWYFTAITKSQISLPQAVRDMIGLTRERYVLPVGETENIPEKGGAYESSGK